MGNDLDFVYDTLADLLLSKDRANGAIACMMIQSQELTDGYRLLQSMCTKLGATFKKNIVDPYHDDLEGYALDESVYTIHQCDMIQVNIENCENQYSTEEINGKWVVTGCDVKVEFSFRRFLVDLNCEIKYDHEKDIYDIRIYSFMNRLIISHDDVEVHYIGKKLYPVFIKKLLGAYDNPKP